MEKYLHFQVICWHLFSSSTFWCISAIRPTKIVWSNIYFPVTPKVFLSDAISKRSTKENYNIKMKATKIQWKTSAPMVPVRPHLFTSHAYVSPFSLLAMWILIYIHIPPLPVAVHPNTFPVGLAVCVSVHPSLIWPRLWAEETSTWVSPIWIPL